jgi:hypothetical protein
LAILRLASSSSAAVTWPATLPARSVRGVPAFRADQSRALSVLFQQALEAVPIKLWVLNYDLFAYADLQRPAILAIEPTRMEICEQVETFAH